MKKQLLLTSLLLSLGIYASAFEPETKKLEYGLGIKPKSTSKSYHQKGYGNPENVVKLKLVPLAFSMASIQYERVLNDYMSVAADLNLLFYSTTTTAGSLSSASLKYSGFGLSPEFRYYPSGNAPAGFFLGPYLTYFGMGFKLEGADITGISGKAEVSGISAFGGGLLLGWKWLIKDAFAIETHLGLNYLNVNIPDKIDLTYSDGRKETVTGIGFSAAGILPTGGLSLGYAF